MLILICWSLWRLTAWSRLIGLLSLLVNGFPRPKRVCFVFSLVEWHKDLRLEWYWNKFLIIEVFRRNGLKIQWNIWHQGFVYVWIELVMWAKTCITFFVLQYLDLEVVFEEAKRLVEFCNSVEKEAKCLINLQFLKHSLWRGSVTNSGRRHRLRNVFRLR